MEAPIPARVTLALLLVATGCATARQAPPLRPLGSEGEVHVFLQPLAGEADRLAFAVGGVALLRPGGGEVPLEIVRQEIDGAHARDQRLLAWGRVSPGPYSGLAVQVGSASLARGGERSRLLVEEAPSRIELSFQVRAGGAVVLWTTLDATRSIQGGFGFVPAFTVALPPQTPAAAALYCTSGGAARVTVADRNRRLVTGALPVGDGPRGIAVDREGRRAYVALSREDEIEILDLSTGDRLGRVSLQPGDGPGELALAADGTLVVVNERSRTVAFVDPVAMAETGRVPVGDDPGALLLDRSGRRAYVANRGAATVTGIDVPNRAVFGTVPTDPEPLGLAVSRDGERLFVVHRGSAYVAVVALPSLSVAERAYVGLGASAVRVDPRTDLVYVAREAEDRITVYEPLAFQPVESLAVPGPVSRMTIDDATNALLAVVPDRQAVAVLDLTSRRLLAEIPVGADPSFLALAGERL